MDHIAAGQGIFLGEQAGSRAIDVPAQAQNRPVWEVGRDGPATAIVARAAKAVPRTISPNADTSYDCWRCGELRNVNPKVTAKKD